MANLDYNGTVYTLHLVYRRTDAWLHLTAAEKQAAAAEVQAVLDRFAAAVEVRGIYSVAGLRHDSDVVFWLLATSLQTLQEVAVAIRRTAFGRATTLSWSFPALTRPPEFVGDHVTAYQKGLPPLGWLCLYPFVRTVDWYLMPREERGKILREHGAAGREFTMVQFNNAQAFGLGDYEWVLAFEADDPQHFVDMIRKLRETEARRYTKEDIPFLVGPRKPLAEVIADLG